MNTFQGTAALVPSQGGIDGSLSSWSDRRLQTSSDGEDISPQENFLSPDALVATKLQDDGTIDAGQNMSSSSSAFLASDALVRSTPASEVQRPHSGSAFQLPAWVRSFAFSKNSGRQNEQNAKVLLHVYDLGKRAITRSYNSVIKSHGAFHSGVEVYGKEWAFGMTSDASTGVCYGTPRQHQQHTYRETLEMGYTHLSAKEVSAIVNEMMYEWMGYTYDVFTRNCHHFSEEFCQRLGVGHIPPWLNALATSSGETVEYIETADSGYDGGQVFVDFFTDIRRFMSGALSSEDPSTKNNSRRALNEDNAGSLARTSQGSFRLKSAIQERVDTA
eukprot:gnl/MRDRNA2_/MRDRNA2_93045_c0_seq1.p1 gnl/MRDRNA2_/MRDRNA2_93045_c0~~gnl/MRDRNA2_/MRDRNA2_93045_c0_seq1.p1  ORF type:complete len:331 (-),score=55.60 gnl/MRDRNA2_/MRDRNA2_93045_c0_seq1:108-1100(-)